MQVFFFDKIYDRLCDLLMRDHGVLAVTAVSGIFRGVHGMAHFPQRRCRFIPEGCVYPCSMDKHEGQACAAGLLVLPAATAAALTGRPDTRISRAAAKIIVIRFAICFITHFLHFLCTVIFLNDALKATERCTLHYQLEKKSGCRFSIPIVYNKS